MMGAGWTVSESHLEIPGDVDDDDPLVAAQQEQQLEKLSALVVERGLPPVFDNQLRHENGDLTVRMSAFELQDVVEQRSEHEAIRRRQEDELRNSSATLCDGSDDIALPHGFDVGATIFSVDVHGFDLVAELHGKAETFLRNA